MAMPTVIPVVHTAMDDLERDVECGLQVPGYLHGQRLLDRWSGLAVYAKKAGEIV